MGAVDRGRLSDENRTGGRPPKITYVGMTDWNRILGFIVLVSLIISLVLGGVGVGLTRLDSGDLSETGNRVVGTALMLIANGAGLAMAVAIMAIIALAVREHLPPVTWKLVLSGVSSTQGRGARRLARNWRVVARRSFPAVVSPGGDVLYPGLKKLKPVPDSDSGIVATIDLPNQYLPGGSQEYLTNAGWELVKSGRLDIAEVGVIGTDDGGTDLVITLRDVTEEVRRWDE